MNMCLCDSAANVIIQRGSDTPGLRNDCGYYARRGIERSACL